MERRPPPHVAPRRTSHPSFSATLLDAIYRSLDANSPEIERTSTKHAKSKPKPDLRPQKKESHSDFWWATMKRKQQAPPSYTSSDSSSYGFSSDAELPRVKPAKANRDPLNPPALPPKTPPQEKKKKSNPFRNRWRELRKGRSTCANSTSPGTGTRSGSPLSKFLKAIFSSSRTPKKKKNTMGSIPVLVPVLPPEEMEDVEDMEAEDVKRRMEEILRGLEKEEEEEGEESDGSSDLFELENLTEIGSDELPVYCTTSLMANHPTVCTT